MIGYREWRVEKGNRLAPIVVGERWRRGKNHAVCCAGAFRFHLAPDPGCSCGFYLLHEPQPWWEYVISGGLITGLDKTKIAGAVVCWGRILRAGGEGFRAEYAQVVAVAAMGRDEERTAERVARYYGVPVFASARGLAEYAQEFGQPII